MKFDVIGRMQNMRLPDGSTALMYSIYEAVSNAIHAIEERFGTVEFSKRGAINILVEFNSDKTLKYIAISDNGIGLNPTHLKSFETCDTRQKAKIHGRGIGRLVWAKVFDQIEVRSSYEVGLSAYEKVSFTFVPEVDESLVNKVVTESRETEVGTQILLSRIKHTENAAITARILTNHLCHHFFPYFIAESMPKLSVSLGRRDLDISAYLSSRVEKVLDEEKTLSTPIGIIKLTHVYADRNIAQKFSNSILLTAQGRVVETVEIEKKFSLRGLENGKAYVCVVGGAFLDMSVDQERTSFKASALEIDAIKQAALDASEQFLSYHISKIRAAQKRIVVDILQEHPQLARSVSDVNAYVGSLSPSMSDEDIGKTLFTLLYRHEKRVKAQIISLSSEEVDEANQANHKTAVSELVQKVSEDAKRRLAEYTIKRHQVIQLAKTLLRYSDDEKQRYHWEKTLHDLICPMGKMLSAKNYDDHNLWLVDDLLSYYSFFASDKALSSLGVDGERKEPDVVFFNPFGFRREGTNDPIVIIEFKRPGDETLSSDPVDQVLGYIEKLQSKTVRAPDGEVITEISEHTPFECIVICDLTAGARKKFARSLAQNPTPDGLGFYGYSPHHKASIRVLSYAKVFRDAQLRNQSFFDKLGLLPQEVREALSLAAKTNTAATGPLTEPELAG